MSNKTLVKDLSTLTAYVEYRHRVGDGLATAGQVNNGMVVASPQSALEAAAVIKYAARNELAIIPQGGLTGYAGGAIPSAQQAERSIGLSASCLNQQLHLSPDSWSGTVSAGVTNSRLRRSAAECGLFFGPNPGSGASCQLGGNVATNAGGPRSFKYGATRNWVSGMQVVLPDGEVVQIGSSTRKSVESFDLTALFCGSEGSLGFITQVQLQLLPAFESSVVQLFTYPSRSTGLAALSAVMSSGVVPSAIEFFDQKALRIAGLEADFGLMIETTGLAVAANAEANLLAEVAQLDSLTAKRADTAATASELWSWRDAVSLKVAAYRGGKLSDDIAVPTQNLGSTLDALDQLATDSGCEITSWGHAGDGIVHASILFDATSAEQTQLAFAQNVKLLEIAKQFGGVLSGEHGIGRAKSEALSLLDPTLARLQHQIKHSIDPAGIMNPGSKIAVG